VYIALYNAYIEVLRCGCVTRYHRVSWIVLLQLIVR